MAWGGMRKKEKRWGPLPGYPEEREWSLFFFDGDSVLGLVQR